MYKLLIADDEFFVLDGLVRNIRWHEYGIDQVELAENGVDALEKAKLFKPDILLSDVKMPGMDGIRLAAGIRELFPSCKFIFMSAYSDKEFLKSAISINAVNYVEKPIDPDEIRSSIASAVALCKADDRIKVAEQPLQSGVVLEMTHSGADRETIAKYLLASGMEALADKSTCAVILKIKPPGADKQGESLLTRNELNQIAEEALKNCNLGCLSAYKDNDTLILIVYSGNQPILELSWLREVCGCILGKVRKMNDIFISVGEIVPSVYDINESYLAAENTLSELFYTGYNHIAVSGEAKRELHDFFQKNLEEFSRLLENGEMEKSIQLIKDLTIKIKPYKNTPVNYIKNLYFFLLMQLHSISAKYGIAPGMDHPRNVFRETLAEYDTIDAVEQYVIGMVDAYYIQLEETTSKGRVVSNTVRVIGKHYADPGLSIKAIGNMLYLNHTYLCGAFKKETGKTINRYLTEYRVEKAKELLKDGSVKVSDICRNVGYTDQNYFTKIFRKVTGMTPTEYRERFA